ncbi:MAG: SpoVA/SpoVAEb family sporulation membrane protein [Lachnospiraceae bacterium]|nr:SpoVA/SpoVAEb family sporulation membrane protein [Lachnospiraceae bacterium]
MEYINAFWVGGLVCALAQILLDRTKMLPGRVMVFLVVTGAIVSFFGLFEPIAEYAGSGITVPLLGYGHLLMSGVKEAIDEYGFIGLFKGGFTNGAVGCAAALVFGYLASLIFKPKTNKA